jgi:shikimate kinase
MNDIKNISSFINSPSGVGGKLFLIGMMGSGKSYWAQLLSAQYKIDWMDLDAEIEKESMMAIKEIFETEGEASFRKKEEKALHNLSKLKNIIVATGGGTPCFYNNMQWMNEHGITIWIDEPIDNLVKRLKPEKTHRPLIKNLSDDELHSFLEKKLNERKYFYSQAQHHLTGNNISELSFEKIIQQHAQRIP